MAELEEKCRRFDQMEFEADMETQRFTQRLKEENEALKGLVVRIGCGQLMPHILEGKDLSSGSAGSMVQEEFANGFAEEPDIESEKAERDFVHSSLGHDTQCEVAASSCQIQPALLRNDVANRLWMSNLDSLSRDSQVTTDEETLVPPSMEGDRSNGEETPLLHLDLLGLVHHAQQGDAHYPPESTTAEEEEKRYSQMLQEPSTKNEFLRQVHGTTNDCGLLTPTTFGGGFAGIPEVRSQIPPLNESASFPVFKRCL